MKRYFSKLLITMSQTAYLEDVLQTGGCLDIDCDSDNEEEHIPYLFALPPLKQPLKPPLKQPLKPPLNDYVPIVWNEDLTDLVLSEEEEEELAETKKVA